MPGRVDGLRPTHRVRDGWGTRALVEWVKAVAHSRDTPPCDDKTIARMGHPMSTIT
jgi:hypothetical protein